MNACLSPNGLNTYSGEERLRRLFVATIGGVSILERHAPGATWQLAGTVLQGQHISSLLWEPRERALFAGIHGQGLYFSADEGRTWEPRMEGISVGHVFSLARAEQGDRVVLYAGTEPAHLFRSEDIGRTWRELPNVRNVPGTDKWMFPAPPHQAHLKCVAVDPRDPARMYAGIEQGALLFTSDGGNTWHELDGYSRPDDDVYKDVHGLMLRPSNPDEVYMSAGMGLYHSPDRGISWEHLSTRKARIGYPDQFQFSPNDDRVIFMAGASQNPGTWRQTHRADSTVVRSEDGGRTWVEANSGLPENMRSNIEAMGLASWPGGFELTIGNTDGDVYLSEDGAQSWSLIMTGLAPISKGGHYVQLRATAA